MTLKKVADEGNVFLLEFLLSFTEEIEIRCMKNSGMAKGKETRPEQKTSPLWDKVGINEI